MQDIDSNDIPENWIFLIYFVYVKINLKFEILGPKSEIPRSHLLIGGHLHTLIGGNGSNRPRLSLADRRR